VNDHRVLAVAVFAHLDARWPVCLAIPVAAGVLGLALNLLARQLTFHPVRTVRVGPVGWQATVVRDTPHLVRLHATLIAGELLSAQEILSRLDPARFTAEIAEPVRRTAGELAVHIAQRYKPGLWELLPERGKRLLGNELRTHLPGVVREVIEQIEANAEDVLDLDHLVCLALTEDPALLQRLIRNVIDPVMPVLERRGAMVGFAIGLLAALVFAATAQPLVLPLAGLAVGLAARPLGQRLLFIRLPFTRSDPFLRLRRPVAVRYAGTVAGEIVTFDRVIGELLHGTHAAKVRAMVVRGVQRAVDSPVSVAKPLVTAAIGSRTLQEMKRAAADGAMQHIPETVRPAEGYATAAMDVRNAVLYRMLRMEPAMFVRLPRQALASGAIRLAALGGMSGLAVSSTSRCRSSRRSSAISPNGSPWR